MPVFPLEELKNPLSTLGYLIKPKSSAYEFIGEPKFSGVEEVSFKLNEKTSKPPKPPLPSVAKNSNESRSTNGNNSSPFVFTFEPKLIGRDHNESSQVQT